jgi:hypothetical protein
MSDIIWIKTHKYSTLLRRIFEEYKKNAEIYIEGHRYSEYDIPQLLDNWCTNRIITRTINFSLKKDGMELFGFHDTPDEFWAAMSERPFVERLASERIIRYRIYPKAYEAFLRDKMKKTKGSLGRSLYKFFRNIVLPHGKDEHQ